MTEVKLAKSFSTREAPWMKLGALTDEPRTAAEAARLGGLDFEVEKRPLWYGDTDDVASAMPINRVSDRVAVVRTDTNEPVGFMARDYAILQYHEAFDFMDQVSPTYVAAGSLYGGKQGFMVSKVPDTFQVLQDVDPHDLYAVLRTSHNGSRAVEVSIMPLRHRCMNQLGLNSFTKGVPHRWSIAHTGNVQLKLQQAMQSIKKLDAYSQSFRDNVHRLIKIKITQKQADAILTDVLPDRPRRPVTITQINQLWHSSETVGFDWTGWGLVNAVSEYMDWKRVGGSPRSRFIGALQGSTRNVLNRTTTQLLTRY